MKVVLTKDVDKLGKLGDTKNVADGFAMHWLIPQGLAVFEDTRLARKLGKRRVMLDQKAADGAKQAATVPQAHQSKAAQRVKQKVAKDAKKVTQLKATKSS